MAMTSEWFDTSDREEPEVDAVKRDAPEGKASKAQWVASRDEVAGPAAQNPVPTLLAPLDPALKALLERTDEHLLDDVGLSRESPFAEVAKFWAEWSRRRGPWGL